MQFRFNRELIGLQSIRRCVRRIRRALPPRLAPLSEDPYTTHLPVLIGLSRLLPIVRVLELGCGEFSTLTFLDRRLFPMLERLDTYENDQGWAENIRKRTLHDPRITLTTIAGPIAEAVANIDFGGYDLIFIDDSTNLTDRTRTIAAVVSRCHVESVLVIHDFEQKSYRVAAQPFGKSFRFKSLNPNTGIVWRDLRLQKAALRRLSKNISLHCRRVCPTDVLDWSRLFESPATL